MSFSAGQRDLKSKKSILKIKAQDTRKRNVKQFHLPFEGQSLVAITLSLGIAVFPEHGATSTGILRAVDAALYRAEHGGRDRVVVAE